MKSNVDANREGKARLRYHPSSALCECQHHYIIAVLLLRSFQGVWQSTFHPHCSINACEVATKFTTLLLNILQMTLGNLQGLHLDAGLVGKRCSVTCVLERERGIKQWLTGHQQRELLTVSQIRTSSRM